MQEYRFSVIVAAPPMTHEKILEATDALGDADCLDASLRGHSEGMELMFERIAESLQAAISTAISDIESTGYRVSRVEMERECIPL